MFDTDCFLRIIGHENYIPNLIVKYLSLVNNYVYSADESVCI